MLSTGTATHPAAGPDSVIWFFSIYFLAVVLIPLGVGAVVSYRALPTGRKCPRCGTATSLLLSAWARLASRIPGIRLQKRWCLSCGWSGLLRSERPSLRLVVHRNPGGTRVVDVRPLLVDGVGWRVQLETWTTGEGCFGRLVFVEPSGRVWPDAQPLRAFSDRELVRQARQIPGDRLLSRLRDLVSG
jgi:hypothetical protein